MNLVVIDLGYKDYRESLKIQKDILEKRKNGEIEDTLLLVEHNPVFTIGKSGSRNHILISDEKLKEENIEVIDIDRGGDITYHGKGQLVGYPIIDLKNHKLGVKDYVEKIEEVIIKTLKEEYGIVGERDSINNGVWVENEKITAVGFSVKRWVTMHGFALNINTNLNHFKYIVPCGIVGREATSVEKKLSQKVDFEVAKRAIQKQFIEVFKYSNYSEEEYGN